jgi:hypothetical protein
VIHLANPSVNLFPNMYFCIWADWFTKGVFIDNAQELIKKPVLTDIDLERRFAITVDKAIASGLTSIHDAGFDPISLEFFKRLA